MADIGTPRTADEGLQVCGKGGVIYHSYLYGWSSAIYNKSSIKRIRMPTQTKLFSRLELSCLILTLTMYLNIFLKLKSYKLTEMRPNSNSNTVKEKEEISKEAREII